MAVVVEQSWKRMKVHWSSPGGDGLGIDLASVTMSSDMTISFLVLGEIEKDRDFGM